MKRLYTILMTAVMLMSVPAFGGGFQLNEHGARAMAMGGAFAGYARDLSAIYFNIAGITYLPGVHMQVGTTLITPAASFRGPSPSVTETKMKSQLFYPSHAYFTYQINDMFTAGFGFNNPFGLGTEWDEGWVGQFITLKSDLKVFSLNPVLGVKLSDKLRLGVGLQYNIATVELSRALNFAPTFNGTGKIDLKGDEKGAIGFAGGLLYQATKEISLGLQYRSEVNYKFKGTATTTGPSQLSANLPAGDIEATFTSPQQFTFGVAVTPSSKLLLTADFQYIMWSSYDSLKIDFLASDTTISSPRLYEDTYIVRLGAEYSYSDNLALRAGLLFDRNPVKDDHLDPLLPDANRIGISAGLGYRISDAMSLDLSYLFLRFSERTITKTEISYSGNSGMLPFTGTYNSTANLFSFSLNYKF
ncbi:MAG: outer membrane protein transport protein [Ignavibacteriaceae bacterium]|nr:outer membrane protein transport protein [Ignavibacteriaceae bacterium]